MKSKKCSITDIKSPALAKLLNKFGPVKGLEIYNTEAEINKLSDSSILQKYFPANKFGKVNSKNKFITSPLSQRSFYRDEDSNIELLEEKAGLASWSVKKNPQGEKENIRQYKDLFSNRSVAETEFNAKQYLINNGLAPLYEVTKKRSSKAGHINIIIRPRPSVNKDLLITERPSGILPESKVKQGVQELFDSNPELASIGTPEQYSQYLDTIFPDNKIAYHGSKYDNLQSLDPNKAGTVTTSSLGNKGVYLTPDREVAERYKGKLSVDEMIAINKSTPGGYKGDFSEFQKGKVYHVLLDTSDVNKNISKTQESKVSYIEMKDEKGNTIGEREYFVTDENSLFLLGGKQDIEGFKEFVQDTEISAETPSGLLPTVNSSLARVETQRLIDLNKNKRALETSLQTEEDILTYLETSKKLEEVKKLIIKTEESIKNIKNIDNTGKLFKQAAIDEKWLEDFFSKREYTFEELNQAILKYDTWAIDIAGVGDQHPYLDVTEMSIPQVVDKMNSISSRMVSRFNSILAARIKEAVLASTKKHSKSENLSNEAILDTLMEDSSALRAYVLNVGKQASIPLQAVFNNINKANNEAYNAAYNRIEKLKEAARGVRKSEFDMFYQKDSEGRYTGSLIHPASLGYIEGLSSILTTIDYALLDMETNPAEAAKAHRIYSKKRKELYNFHMESSEVFDPSAFLFDSSTFEIMNIGLPADIFIKNRTTPDREQEEIRKMEARFGKAEARRIQRNIKHKALQFQRERDALISEKLNSKSQLSASDIEFIKEWSIQNSPYIAYNSFITKTLPTVDGKTGFANFKYSNPVPNEANMDSSFKEILSDEGLLNFYNVVVDLMTEGKNELGDISGFLTGLSVPLMEESFYRQMLQSGKVMPKIMDALKESISVAKEESYQNNNLSYTGLSSEERGKQLNTTSVSRYPIEKRVREIVDSRRIQYIEENGADSYTKEIEKQFRKDAIDEVYRTSSSNLVAIMSFYALNTQTLRARRSIEPQIKLIERFIKDESNSNTINQKNAIKALDYFLDREFYGINPGNDVGKGGATVRTSSQQEVVNNIEREIFSLEEKLIPLKEKEESGQMMTTREQVELQEYEERIEELKKQAEATGRKIKGSKILDGFNSLTQLIGIGFSPISALSNVGFGYISNQLGAAEGRDFGADSLARAYGFILGGNSVKFWTFGLSPLIIESTHGTKIRNMIDKNQMVSTIFDNIKLESTSLVGKSKGMFRASHLMERSEFVNQASILVAMMLDTEVVLSDGTTTNLYDAYDENGDPNSSIVSYTTKSGESREWNPDEFFQYVKQVVEELHGDYNHSVLAKKSAIGRTLLTFRSWMPRTYANRYEPEYYDSISGYVRKGRYLSANNLFTAVPGLKSIPLIGKIMPPIVFASTDQQAGETLFSYSSIPDSVKKKLGITNKAGQRLTLAESLKRVIKNTGRTYGDFLYALRNPLKYKTRFKNRLENRGYSDADASNITSVFTEWVIKTQLALSMLLIYNLMDDGEDDAERMAIIGTMNLLRRFESDISFYLDITEQGRTLDNPIPSLMILTKAEELSDAIGRLYDDRNDYVKSGLYEGWWWPARAAVRMVPGVVALDRVSRYLNVDVQTGRYIDDRENLHDAFGDNLLYRDSDYTE